jgi:hypothetical protein
VQLELENLKLFDLAAQEYYRDEFMQQSTHTTSKNQNLRARKTEAMVRHPCRHWATQREVLGAPTSSSRKKIKAWPLRSDGETELPGTKTSWN